MLKRQLNLKFLFVIAVTVAFFAMALGCIQGCATTPKGKVIETQNTFKAMVETYNREMDFQQNEIVKQEWRELFPPLFEKADKALKAYETAVLQGFGVEQKRQLILFIKNQIILEFLRANIEFNDPEGEVK